jgi:ADP-ribose pyrophosphatase YjhB (NUDIX family)
VVNIAEAGTAVDIVTADQHWQSTWYPAADVPSGTAHGSAGVCLADGQIVLVTEDGRRWQLPGGRPDDGEAWADTLDREVREEACATVLARRLLGFSRGVCLRGPEAGLVLVRALWRADVRLEDWSAEYEMTARRLVPQRAVWDALSIPAGYEPIYRRILVEAVGDRPWLC